MQHTPNFNLNLPEGTDLWNYLTQTNPNFATLDTLLKSIQDGTVTTATEVASGTAHAITRTLPDANVIRFTATSAWTIGDTMTIDGTPVTVVKPNGTNLQTGDYIIGSEVLGVLRATQFTVYLGAPSSLDAANIDYNNTQSGLTATNVQGAIDEVNSNLGDLNDLTTTDKTSIVNAINELVGGGGGLIIDSDTPATQATKIPQDYAVGITIGNTTTTFPSGSAGSGVMITISKSTTSCAQIAIDYTGAMWSRGASNYNAWTAWKKHTTT